MHLTDKEDQLASFGAVRADSVCDTFAWLKKKYTLERELNGLDTYSHWCYLNRDKPSAYFETGIQRVKDITGLDFIVQSLTSDSCFLFNDELVVSMSKVNEYYSVVFTGNKEYVIKLRDANEWSSKPTIHWYYLDHRGDTLHNNLTFHFDGRVVDCHYPYIKQGVDNYMDEFRESLANLLLLMGDPGTGKSTFIKHYIKKYNQKAMLTHDEALLGSDSFMVGFLSNPEIKLLIIEDADLLLKSREFAGNKVMSKLLNVADGVLKLTHGKKIILSTNLTTLDDVDTALTRPGRCFDVLNFRDLSHKEANQVCKEHDLDPVFEIRDYSLAEVFNRKEFVRPERRTKVGII